MTVMMRSLDDPEDWQLGYDTEAKRLYVECPSDPPGKQFAVNDFLAQDRGQLAQNALVLIFVDLFGNTAEDHDNSDD